MADLRHGRRVVVREPESGHHVAGPLEEEADRGEVRQIGMRRVVHVPVRCQERGHGQHGLLGDAEGLPARGEDAQPGAGREELRDEIRDGVHEMLAVVENEHQLPVGDVLPECGRPRVARALLHPQDGGDGLRHQCGVVQPVELDQPHPVGEDVPEPGRGAQRETGLPDPADARQGQQARARQQLVHLSQVRVTTDKAGEFCGKVPPCGSGLRHHRTTLRQTPPSARLARRFHRESLEGCVEQLKGAPEQQGCGLLRSMSAPNQEHLPGEQA